MKIGDNVIWKDRTFFVKRKGIVQKISNDGSKSLVSVTGKFSKEWIKTEHLNVINE